MPGTRMRDLKSFNKKQSLRLGKVVSERIGRKKASRLSLRMAPLIDIIFLLLIFFLVTAKWRPEEDFLPFQLPKAKGSQVTLGRPEPLIITVSMQEEGCRVRIGSRRVCHIDSGSMAQDLAGLMEQMRTCMTIEKRYAGDPVEIICGPRVKWDYVARIYNTFYGAGLTDITFRMTE